MAGKGQPKTGGRQKGTSNKLTADVKQMIIEALHRAHPGGPVAYLTQQSQENPKAFLTLVGKVLPLTVAGDPNSPLLHAVERRIVKPE